MNMIRFNQPTLGFMDQLFSNTMTDSGKYNYPANIYDNTNSFVIELSAPGFSKEDIRINLEQQTLNITAEVKQQEELQDEKFLRREFYLKDMNRSFILPKSVDVDKINADYKNGVLKVTLPRKEEAVVKKEITIQ